MELETMATRKLRASPAPSQPAAYGYCRVSTDQQRDSGISIEEQRRKIEARAAEMGWNLAGVFVDAGVSGSIPLAQRPEGARLLEALRRVISWSPPAWIGVSARPLTRSKPSKASKAGKSPFGFSTSATCRATAFRN
jgi:hypothetical protein